MNDPMHRTDRRSPSFGPAALGLLLLCAVAAATTDAEAQTRIAERHALSRDATVSLGSVDFSLEVSSWERNEISITGTYDEDEEEIVVGGSAEAFHFEIRPKRRVSRLFGFSRRSGSGGGVVAVRLPAGVRLTAASVSGEVTVSGLSGSITAKSVSGSVDVTGRLTSAFVSAVSGDVRYTGDAPTVTLKAVSGSVTYRGKARDVRLEAVSGALEMAGAAETIDAESVSGSVDLASDLPVRSLEASSVSGSIDFQGRLAPGARVDVESHSGTVELVLGGTPDARFELESFSGDVRSRLAGMKDEVKSEGRGPGTALSFTTGSGAGRVSATSFSGSVRVLSDGGR